MSGTSVEGDGSLKAPIKLPVENSPKISKGNDNKQLEHFSEDENIDTTAKQAVDDSPGLREVGNTLVKQAVDDSPGLREAGNTLAKQAVDDSPGLREDGNTLAKQAVEDSPETKEDGNRDTPVKEEVVNSPKTSKYLEGSLTLEKALKVKSLESLTGASDNVPTEVEESGKNEESSTVLIEEMELLSLTNKSPVGRSSRSKDKGSQSKPKVETPSKSRSRARSTADVFESPYNTRLKAKLMREREQRSLSEDSGKRDPKQT